MKRIVETKNFKRAVLVLGCMILGLVPIFSSMSSSVDGDLWADSDSFNSPKYYVVAESGGSRLKGGKYLLKVEEVVPGVTAQEGDEYVHLVVIEPFWRTWWFKGMTLFVALALFVALYNQIHKAQVPAPMKNKEDVLRDKLKEFRLSPREKEVVNLLLQGKSNRTIENELFISSHTVKNHIYNIYQKLGVKRRTQIFNLLQSS